MSSRRFNRSMPLVPITSGAGHAQLPSHSTPPWVSILPPLRDDQKTIRAPLGGCNDGRCEPGLRCNDGRCEP
eukprot:5132587-Pyramimonas_sp.AAC.1